MPNIQEFCVLVSNPESVCYTEVLNASPSEHRWWSSTFLHSKVNSWEDKVELPFHTDPEGMKNLAHLFI